MAEIMTPWKMKATFRLRPSTSTRAGLSTSTIKTTSIWARWPLLRQTFKWSRNSGQTSTSETDQHLAWEISHLRWSDWGQELEQGTWTQLLGTTDSWRCRQTSCRRWTMKTTPTPSTKNSGRGSSRTSSFRESKLYKITWRRISKKWKRRPRVKARPDL